VALNVPDALLVLHRRKGSRKAGVTLGEYLTNGKGLVFDFRLHAEVRTATWEGVSSDAPAARGANSHSDDTARVGVGVVLPSCQGLLGCVC
jgi:hypothetical protein